MRWKRSRRHRTRGLRDSSIWRSRTSLPKSRPENCSMMWLGSSRSRECVLTAVSTGNRGTIILISWLPRDHSKRTAPGARRRKRNMCSGWTPTGTGSLTGRTQTGGRIKITRTGLVFGFRKRMKPVCKRQIKTAVGSGNEKGWMLPAGTERRWWSSGDPPAVRQSTGEPLSMGMIFIWITVASKGRESKERRRFMRAIWPERWNRTDLWRIGARSTGTSGSITLF